MLPHIGPVLGCVLALALAAGAARDARADTGPIRLDASAGVGGLARPGRWLPVFLHVDYTGAGPLRAATTLRWGSTTVVRHLDLASAGRVDIELYVRSSDPGQALEVTLEPHAPWERQRLNVPVRLLRYDETASVCVVVPGALQDGAAECTASVPASDLPASLRGYDAVDRVLVSDAAVVAIAPDRQRALSSWRSWRALEEAGDLAFSGQPSRPLLARGLPPPAARQLAGTVGLYVSVLAAIGLAARRRFASLSTVGISLGVAGTAAGAALISLGDWGAARSLRVEHTSLLQQIPGSDRALLSMSGVVRFPAFDEFSLRLLVPDASMEVAFPSAKDQRVAADGYPTLAGTFGLGARRSFSVEGVVQTHPLVVTADRDMVRIQNRSTSALTDCRFGDGFDRGPVGHLGPGAGASARRISSTPGPVATCVLSDRIIAFEEARRAVESSGRTTVMAYLSAAAGAAAGGPLHD